jgi:hypothetical protein
MAETKRMTAEQVVGYLLEGEGLDVLRESLAWAVQQLMEAEARGPLPVPVAGRQGREGPRLGPGRAQGARPGLRGCTSPATGR